MVKKKVIRPLSSATNKNDNKDDFREVKATMKLIHEKDLPEMLRKKFFLFTPKIKSVEFFYLPCWSVVLKYYISYFNAYHMDRGNVEFIVDPINGCGFNEDKLELRFTKRMICKDIINEKGLSKEQAEKKAIIDARWKVLLSKYKRPPELEIVSAFEFFRPYYKVNTIWGNHEEIQWIPADDFANYFIYN